MVNEDDKVELIRLTDIPKLLGIQKSYGALYRWVNQGIRGVKLKSQLIGGTRYTTKKDFDAFIAKINGKRRSPATVKIANATADAELEAMGL